MLVLAHRGASADAPENTVPAFLEAVRQGADGVELDVMRCRSGELVVCHDEWLDRLAGVHWEVAARSYPELRTLDVGTPLGFQPAHLPLLEEVVDALPGSFLFNFELKCITWDDRGLAQEVGRFIERRGLEGRTWVSSFNAACLWRFKRAFPLVRRGYLLDPDKSFLVHGGLLAPRLSSASVHPEASQCSAARVARWHARGWKVITWTVDDPAEARRLQALGVDVLITNRPATLRAALGSGV